MTYVWKKRFYIHGVTLDSEWKSQDNNFMVRPEKQGRATSIHGFYIVEHDKADDKYKEKAIREIKNIFACYSLLHMKSTEIGYFIPDKLMNKAQLEKQGLPIPPTSIGPIKLHVRTSFESKGFEAAYTLYQKIINDNKARALETCIRWFKKGLSDELSYDKFLALWISFNAFYNLYWTSKKTSQNGNEAQKMRFLVKTLFDETSSKDVITSKRCFDHINYITSNFIGRYCSNSGRTDWVNELSIHLSQGRFHKAIEKLVLTMYSIRGTLFHGERSFSQQEEIAIIQANAPLGELIRKCIELYLQ